MTLPFCFAFQLKAKIFRNLSMDHFQEEVCTWFDTYIQVFLFKAA